MPMTHKTVFGKQEDPKEEVVGPFAIGKKQLYLSCNAMLYENKRLIYYASQSLGQYPSKLHDGAEFTKCQGSVKVSIRRAKQVFDFHARSLFAEARQSIF